MSAKHKSRDKASDATGKNGQPQKQATSHRLLFFLGPCVVLLGSLLLGKLAWQRSPEGGSSLEDQKPESADGREAQAQRGTQEQQAPQKRKKRSESGKLHSKRRTLTAELHPMYRSLIKEYPFQPVVNNRGEYVNIILVRSPFRSQQQYDLFSQYKEEILFLGISSFEDYPLPPANPFSPKFPANLYPGMFPGFLHMFRDTSIFPNHVKLLLMSQSDFALPHDWQDLPKKYDFTFSGSDQDVLNDCVGWSSFAKNWTFVKEALDVMCGEYGMTGVLVATKAKKGSKACSIPESCKGKMKQTRFIDQSKYFKYLKQSRFAFVPQVHDASPRVTTQALALNVPLLVNRNIVGGWKYVNAKTGEFFNDMSDFRASLERVMSNLEQYRPREYVFENLGDRLSGLRLKQFVEENFQDRVKLPEGSQFLMPSGA